MGRHRSRSMSQSPARRYRYDAPYGRSQYRYGGEGFRQRSSFAPTGLLIRNIALETRTADIRSAFERFGPLRDVYLPKNYHTGVRRGFGFVKFQHGDDAAMAKQEMHHKVIDGREITILFADEKRKTPYQMRNNARISDRYDGRRRSRSKSPRQRYRSYSHCSSSPSPGRDSRERGRRRDSLSLSPQSRSISRSPTKGRDRRQLRSRSPDGNGRIRSISPDQRSASLDNQSPPRGSRSSLADRRSPSPEAQGRRSSSPDRRGSPRSCL